MNNQRYQDGISMKELVYKAIKEKTWRPIRIAIGITIIMLNIFLLMVLGLYIYRGCYKPVTARTEVSKVSESNVVVRKRSVKVDTKDTRKKDSETILSPREVTLEDVGKVVVVQGRVKGRVVRPSVMYIHFYEDDRLPGYGAFQVTIFEKDFKKWAPHNPINMYQNKVIRVKGKLEEFRRNPQIIVSSPKEVMIIDEE